MSGNLFLAELSVPDDSPNYGIAWLSSFGSIDKLDIKENEEYVVDNNHFLECDSTVKYTIKTLGGIKSSLLSSSDNKINETLVGAMFVALLKKTNSRKKCKVIKLIVRYCSLINFFNFFSRYLTCGYELNLYLDYLFAFTA
jgi:hypothetical protein